MDGHATPLFRRHVLVSRSSHFYHESRQLTKGRYVAMNAMQEDNSVHSHGHGHEHGLNGYADSNGPAQRKPKGPQMRDTLATIGGMLVPLLTQFGHHH